MNGFTFEIVYRKSNNDNPEAPEFLPIVYVKYKGRIIRSLVVEIDDLLSQFEDLAWDNAQRLLHYEMRNHYDEINNETAKGYT